MNIKQCIAAACFSMTATTVAAQDSIGPHNILFPSELPATAQKLGDYIPVGWKVEQQLDADLNADQLPDAVLVVVAPEEAEEQRVLLVLLAKAAGGWQRVGLSTNVLLTANEFGPMSGSPKLSKKEGVLVIRQDGGSRYAVFRTQRFRHDKVSGRLRLIGEERSIIDRQGNGREASYSTNLLIGQQLIRVSGPNSEGKLSGRNANRKRQFTLRPLYLEDIDNRADDATHALPWLPTSYSKYE